MIEFYTNSSGGPIVQKILFMLHETNISYKTVEIDMNNDIERINNLSNINPNKTVPIIKDDETGAIVFESNAILFYLAEKANLFLPTTEVERVEVIKWLIFEAANFGAVMGELYYYILKSSNELSDPHLQRYKDKMSSFCAILNDQLSRREYICGQFSIADVSYYPWLFILKDLADVDINNYPNLNKWAEMINNRQSPIKQ
ncbi:MAG: glutathione S-transferase family protein [Gammaproteobacteria bacterium]